MEKKEKDPIQTFDTLYTTNQIQIMKILLPFCDEQARRSLAVMIKFMELQYTISFTQKHPDAFHEAPLPFSLADVCGQIKAYCPPQLRSMLEQLQSMQSALKMYEDMKQMMELFQDGEGDGASPFASLMGMGTDGQTGGTAAAESSEASEAPVSPEPSDASDSEGREPSGSFNPFGSGDPMNMLLGFLSPDQQELFRMLSPDPDSPDARTANKRNTDSDCHAQTAPS